ncbi:MAG TPA: sigma 54-interacting transcriptional regulator [Archangium sp.]|uniref:sigma 54-interacting transcriptional regulator n=1 Tax=Archangium sp. TaxID=1872627 RepID=UPI002E3171E2|nr:sigma 54-interacting transcriptional regulator [Archangium sp.]HEX5746669.1 sigma 54-interacting transcriptional regulator [Archangium sp.]
MQGLGLETSPLTRARAPHLQFRVLVVSGPDSGRGLALDCGRYEVGTASSCQLVLSDRTISRRHLALEVSEERVRALDLGSRNGSYCEGMRFSELEVRPGALLTLGTTELKLVLADTREASLPLSTRERFGGLVGRSQSMRGLFAVLERLAASHGDVLIQGETGTGKELCAEAIHAESPRGKGPFVIVDLAGIAPSLIESELFGHVKGAFTGAHGDRAGVFEQARGGTVFLDEVGELPLELQPRLLRVLERRQVKRVGGNDYRGVDVRVVAATHVDLEAAVEAGRFRRDLFHRLAVLRVALPPLREQSEDVPLLIDTVLARMGHPPSALSDQTRALLGQYPWPGNVRELRNMVEQVVSLGEDALRQLDASPERGSGRPHTPPREVAREVAGPRPPRSEPPGPALPFKEAKEQLIEGFERDYLKSLLARCEGNQSRAAREAGIDRVYLRRLLLKHGLDE